MTRPQAGPARRSRLQEGFAASRNVPLNDNAESTTHMNGKRRPLLAALAFFAFTAPLGIAAHLISELAGLGWHDDADVAFSSRHAYLAVLALLALGALLLAMRRLPRGRRRAALAELIDSLPFRGRGLGFTLASFLAQFAFFAVTQLGEGCPLCGGDVITGIFAAASAALLGAIAIALGKRRILEFALALIEVFVAAGRAAGAESVLPNGRVPRPLANRRSPFSFRYRPPPLIAIRPTA